MRVLDGGYWLGRYWLMLDGGTCINHPVIWFDTPLEALEFLGRVR